MTLVAGVDCSTQATKVLVCDAGTGEVRRQGRAPHVDRTEVDPAVWWEAFEEASAGLLDGVRAIGIGGQQHGMVLRDDSGVPVRDALLWNDNRSAPEADQLIAELGGPPAWADATGLVPVASFTVSKLRWVAAHEPEIAARATSVALPHDWLTHRLDSSSGPISTDRGDASGTGYWSPYDEDYRRDLLRLAFGRDLATPHVAGTHEPVGETARGAILAPGTGDNMAAALALDLTPGDVVVSLGTSGTVFAVSDRPAADPTGVVAGFADATGRFLPLVCTLNAARVLTAAAELTGVPLEQLGELALTVDGSDGLVLLPFLDGERTPPLPDATGLLHGLTRRNSSRAHLARAAIEGMLCGLIDAVDALRNQGIEPRRIVLVGGAARSTAVQQIAAELFRLDVAVPEPREYVALGAARQAAWTLAGSDRPPAWAVTEHVIVPDDDTRDRAGEVRTRYREVLQGALPLLESKDASHASSCQRRCGQSE